VPARGSSRCLSRSRRSSPCASLTCDSPSTKNGRSAPSTIPSHARRSPAIGSGTSRCSRRGAWSCTSNRRSNASCALSRTRDATTWYLDPSCKPSARPAQHSSTRSGRNSSLRSIRPHWDLDIPAARAAVAWLIPPRSLQTGGPPRGLPRSAGHQPCQSWLVAAVQACRDHRQAGFADDRLALIAHAATRRSPAFDDRSRARTIGCGLS
jgi:hypothetical protein